ncbi:chondroitinase family protein [Paenibacillus yanchengensis]|uniref:Chondroitinase family protein n=1 Tax=Paenibacillus yanchengensis TaxID=2035833 RepID=A0ABW4YG34_9BACL
MKRGDQREERKTTFYRFLRRFTATIIQLIYKRKIREGGIVLIKSKRLTILLVMSLICSLLIPVSTLSAATEVQPESFEGTNVPQEWSAIGGGSVSLSNLHAKTGSNSLMWTWSNGSKLQSTNLPNIAEAMGNKGG